MASIKTVYVVSDVIDSFYSSDTVHIDNLNNSSINSYVLFRSVTDEKHSAIARYTGNGHWKRIKAAKHLAINSFEPRDSHQAAFMDTLTDKGIILHVALGAAGTGKTTLALAKAAEDWLTESKRIVLSKPTATVGVGRAFGPVPGTIEEKYDPYLASYKIVLDKIFGGQKGFIDRLKAKKDLEFQPVELARGCTFDNCTFILDEAQNLTWHELNTIISRMGENTKMIILGDLNQIDVPMWKHETGLYKLVNSPPFGKSKITSCITLKNQYRSPITALVAEVNEWVVAKDKKSETQ